MATACGTTPQVVIRLVDARILPERPDGFLPSDAAKVRLVLALEASGVPFEALRGAVQAGRLSFDFVEQLMPSPSLLLSRSHAELAAGLPISRRMVERVRSLLGTAEAPDSDPVRDADATIFQYAARAAELGAGEDHLVRVLIVYIDAVRRIVDVERDFVDEVLHRPFLEAGGSEVQMLAATSARRLEYRQLGRTIVDLLHQRQSDNAVFQNVTELIERALAREGIIRPAAGAPPAIAFVDVSGYTRLTEEAGDSAAAKQAGRLAELVQEVVTRHEGRLVKLLGDGVMLHFRETTAGVLALLELVERAPSAGLPALHAGLDAGPVIRRDGDYFGAVVNVAARTADFARPNEVLVTAAAVQTMIDTSRVDLMPIGPIALRNVRQPVEIYQVSRAGSRRAREGQQDGEG